MDSFFLAEPIHLDELKAKNTINKNPIKFLSISLYPKCRHYCIKKRFLMENMVKISARRARNLLRVTPCCEIFSLSSFK